MSPDGQELSSGEPGIVTQETEPYCPLPEIRLNFSPWDLSIESPVVHGYAPDDFQDRSYYIELWIEKSTQDDILVPLCKELGITLVTSVGFQSLSNVVKLLQRVHQRQKPCRVLYVSDYDKSGDSMPVAVARHIEFWLPEYAPGADVKLMHLALTAAQVDSYKLPQDESGRVELDALEARVPGELEKLVREATAPYEDRTIGARLRDAEQEADRLVDEEWSALMEQHERKLARIHRQVKAVLSRYEKGVSTLNYRLQEDLAKFRTPLEGLRSAVMENSRAFGPELPERPMPVVEREQDGGGWLFDSSRDYLEQLARYKEHQGKG